MIRMVMEIKPEPFLWRLISPNMETDNVLAIVAYDMENLF